LSWFWLFFVQQVYLFFFHDIVTRLCVCLYKTGSRPTCPVGLFKQSQENLSKKKVGTMLQQGLGNQDFPHWHLELLMIGSGARPLCPPLMKCLFILLINVKFIVLTIILLSLRKASLYSPGHPVMLSVVVMIVVAHGLQADDFSQLRQDEGVLVGALGHEVVRKWEGRSGSISRRDSALAGG